MSSPLGTPLDGPSRQNSLSDVASSNGDVAAKQVRNHVAFDPLKMPKRKCARSSPPICPLGRPLPRRRKYAVPRHPKVAIAPSPSAPKSPEHLLRPSRSRIQSSSSLRSPSRARKRRKHRGQKKKILLLCLLQPPRARKNGERNRLSSGKGRQIRLLRPLATVPRPRRIRRRRGLRAQQQRRRKLWPCPLRAILPMPQWRRCPRRL